MSVMSYLAIHVNIIIKKTYYFAKHMKEMLKDYFGNSPLQFASSFTKLSNMSASELEDLKK